MVGTLWAPSPSQQMRMMPGRQIDVKGKLENSSELFEWVNETIVTKHGVLVILTSRREDGVVG